MTLRLTPARLAEYFAPPMPMNRQLGGGRHAPNLHALHSLVRQRIVQMAGSMWTQPERSLATDATLNETCALAEAAGDHVVLGVCRAADHYLQSDTVWGLGKAYGDLARRLYQWASPLAMAIAEAEAQARLSTAAMAESFGVRPDLWQVHILNDYKYLAMIWREASTAIAEGLVDVALSIVARAHVQIDMIRWLSAQCQRNAQLGERLYAHPVYRTLVRSRRVHRDSTQRLIDGNIAGANRARARAETLRQRAIDRNDAMARGRHEYPEAYAAFTKALGQMPAWDTYRQMQRGRRSRADIEWLRLREGLVAARSYLVAALVDGHVGRQHAAGRYIESATQFIDFLCDRSLDRVKDSRDHALWAAYDLWHNRCLDSNRIALKGQCGGEYKRMAAEAAKLLVAHIGRRSDSSVVVRNDVVEIHVRRVIRNADLATRFIQRSFDDANAEAARQVLRVVIRRALKNIQWYRQPGGSNGRLWGFMKDECAILEQLAKAHIRGDAHAVAEWQRQRQQFIEVLDLLRRARGKPLRDKHEQKVGRVLHEFLTERDGGRHWSVQYFKELMDEHYPAPVFAQDDVPNVYEPALLDGPADSEELLRWQSG